MRHFGVPSALTTRQAGFGHVGGKRGVPEDLLRDLALRRNGTRFAEGHAGGLLRREFFHPVDVLGERIDGGGTVGGAATRDGGAQRIAAIRRHADAPLVDRLAVRDADVGRAGHRQPGVGEAPAQGRILLAVVHVPVDRLAIDGLDVIREELRDVLIGAPVQGHAQVVAVLGLELVLQVLAGEQIGAEPVEVGELLVGQLIELAVGGSGEARADEVLQVETRIGVFLANAGHIVGQRQDLAVAVVGADEVGIADPAVVDRLAGLHRSLQLLHDVTLLDDVVLDLDAGDLLEGLGQGLALVLVGGDRLGHHRDLLHALGLKLFGGLDEPLHLGHLLIFAQRGRLELAVDPFLGFGLPGPGAVADDERRDRESHRIHAKSHCCLLQLLPMLDVGHAAGMTDREPR